MSRQQDGVLDTRARRVAAVRQGMRFRRWLASSIALAALALAGGRACADRIELSSGGKVEGEITSRDDQSITVKTTIGGRTFTRKYPLGRVRAIVTEKGREVISAGGKAAAPPGMKSGPASGKGAPASQGAAPGRAPQRTKAEVIAMIEEQGRTQPEWWDSVPLEYPKTLDLSFPEPAPGGWNNQRNIGQWIWDIINPNPGKWRQGVRFMHYLLTVHKDHAETRQRVMEALGRMYFVLLQDHARAAFWWRQARVEESDRSWSGVQLAECYWRLGNKEMAINLLDRIDLQFATIKLLADMGETRRALQIAEQNVGGEADDLAYLYAGDACRVAGQHRQALQYYERLLRVPVTGQAKGRIERNQKRAQASIEAIKVFDLLDLARVPDGTYRSSSIGYEAPVHVEVTVKAGRIENVRVSDHREKQFYSAMTDTCRKIMAKQGVTGIDATSCATITSEAIINATAKALAGAMKP